MSQKSFFKDLTRSITKTRARFLSIFAIITLGVGFFSGINATEPDMILSADQYYQIHNLSDFRIISPLGFSTGEIDAVNGIDGVAQVQTGYAKDAFLSTASGETNATVRLFSYNPADKLNLPTIQEGRMPAASGEIAIESGANVPNEIKIGSVVTLSLPDGEPLADSLAASAFTVVGRIASPLYINFERGQTNIGDGSISFFAYVPENDFTMDKVTDLFVRTAASPALTAYSDAYDKHLTPLENVFDKLGMDAIAAETAQMRADLDAGQAELQAKRDQAEQELAAAEQKLLDAEQAILDGENELNRQEVLYSRELADQKAKLAQGQADLAAGQRLYEEKDAQWLAGYQAYQAGAKQLSAAKVQLDSAAIQISQGEAELAAAKKQLDASAAQVQMIQDSLVVLNKIQSAMPGSLPPLSDQELNRLIAGIQGTNPVLAEIIRQLYQISDPGLRALLFTPLNQNVNQLKQDLESIVAQYEAGLAQYNAGLAKITASKSAYDAGRAEYQSGLAQLEASKVPLDSGKSQLDQAKATLDASAVQLKAGAAALARGETALTEKLAAGRQELAAAKIELAAGRVTFEAEKTEALRKIEAAEADIRDAERKILEIPDHWFVLTRDGNPGYSGYGDDARRIGAVAKVFPLFFFLVAALVCLTTMTRMVEEERGQIGTLKALGYSTLTIASKYLIYALLASLTGALAGLAIGFSFFPRIIMGAYGMMYQIPERLTPFHANYAAISILIAVLTTVSAALLATLQELRSEPAVLMQPKAPKPGKRILLERIQPIWKLLSFSHKVTARNIFRYKRRFLMTVIGIAGCTALLVTGFGLRDSINAIIGKQFGEVFLYDGQLAVNLEKDAAERDMGQILGEYPEIKSWMGLMNETVSTRPGNSDRTFEATLLVPASADQFSQFYDLHERVSGKTLTLSADGAVISEKLAGLLAVGVGDTLSYQDTENRTYQIKVAGIAENYLTHFIYLSPEYFDIITYRTPEYNGAVFNLNDAKSLDRKAFKEELLSHDGILGAVFSRSIADEFADTIGNLDTVVLILILSAGALAFIVLYNLTNINITERIREIATIKVLGFRDQEVSAYVYRENFILTAIGTLGGLLLGFVLHQFVIGTMEVDNMMFGKTIKALSYLLSVALTLSFAALVNLFMHEHLRRVNMVESLKSVE